MTEKKSPQLYWTCTLSVEAGILCLLPFPHPSDMKDTESRLGPGMSSAFLFEE